MHYRFLGTLLAICSASTWAQSPVQRCLEGSAGKTIAGSGDTNAHTEKLETNLWPRVISQHSKPDGLLARMSYYAVPGVSIAVVHDGKIDWMHGWGVRNAASCAPVTPETRFQAASISKAVTAMLAMRLVEQGKIELDADINASLEGWQLPKPDALEPGFVTLRQILSHTAGLTVHGFPGYQPGAPLPSVRQILDGVAPANTPAVRIEHAPGSRFQYSGGGYTIVQLALEQVGGRPFSRLATNELFGPLHMQHSGFDQPPATGDPENASAHVQGSVVAGGFHVYPEWAAAGLWTTPRDLARLLIDVQAAWSGKARHRLSTATMQQMLMPQVDGWGLGFALKGDGDALRFGHDGVNEGFESSMVAYAKGGEGVVVMTNGQGGRQLADEVIRGIAADYRWAELAPHSVTEVGVPDAVLARHVGSYEAPGIEVGIERDDVGLLGRIGGLTSERLLALSPTRFISQASGAVVEFEGEADGEAPSTGFRILEGGPLVLVPRSTAKSVLIGTTPIFLRGSMNDWSLAAPATQTSPQVFAVELDLDAGDYEFKLASEDWQTVDLGVAGAAPDFSADSGAIALVQRGMNIRLRLEDAGKYRFVVDGSQGTGASLRVSRLRPRTRPVQHCDHEGTAGVAGDGRLRGQSRSHQCTGGKRAGLRMAPADRGR